MGLNINPFFKEEMTFWVIEITKEKIIYQKWQFCSVKKIKGRKSEEK